MEESVEDDQVVTLAVTAAINDTTKHVCIQKQSPLLTTPREGNQNSSPSSVTNVSKLLSKVNIHADAETTVKTSTLNVVR